MITKASLIFCMLLTNDTWIKAVKISSICEAAECALAYGLFTGRLCVPGPLDSLCITMLMQTSHFP